MNSISTASKFIMDHLYEITGINDWEPLPGASITRYGTQTEYGNKQDCDKIQKCFEKVVRTERIEIDVAQTKNKLWRCIVSSHLTDNELNSELQMAKRRYLAELPTEVSIYLDRQKRDYNSLNPNDSPVKKKSEINSEEVPLTEREMDAATSLLYSITNPWNMGLNETARKKARNELKKYFPFFYEIFDEVSESTKIAIKKSTTKANKYCITLHHTEKRQDFVVSSQDIRSIAKIIKNNMKPPTTNMDYLLDLTLKFELGL